MEHRDLEIAKSKLIGGDLSLVIVKRGKVVFEAETLGIGGFLQAIEKFGGDLGSSSVADKVVGVAAAMLCVYSGVVSVFALTLSEGGAKILEANNITYSSEKRVSNILNRSKNDVCPFEKLAMASVSADEAYVKLRALAKEMMLKSEKSG